MSGRPSHVCHEKPFICASVTRGHPYVHLLQVTKKTRKGAPIVMVVTVNAAWAATACGDVKGLNTEGVRVGKMFARHFKVRLAAMLRCIRLSSCVSFRQLLSLAWETCAWALCLGKCLPAEITASV